MNADDPKVVVIIPARYASTRLPGKPLVSLAGKPMVQRVYERAKQAQTVHQVVVATDDQRIELFRHRRPLLTEHSVDDPV